MRLSMIATTKIFRFSTRQLHNDDQWNHVSYITLQIKTSSLLFTRLKYVKNYLLCQKSLFLCLTCHVHHVWNRNKKQIFKDIFRINFSCCNKQSLFISLASRHSILWFQSNYFARKYVWDFEPHDSRNAVPQW